MPLALSVCVLLMSCSLLPPPSHLPHLSSRCIRPPPLSLRALFVLALHPCISPLSSLVPSSSFSFSLLPHSPLDRIVADSGGWVCTRRPSRGWLRRALPSSRRHIRRPISTCDFLSPSLGASSRSLLIPNETFHLGSISTLISCESPCPQSLFFRVFPVRFVAMTRGCRRIETDRTALRKALA